MTTETTTKPSKLRQSQEKPSNVNCSIPEDKGKDFCKEEENLLIFNQTHVLFGKELYKKISDAKFPQELCDEFKDIFPDIKKLCQIDGAKFSVLSAIFVVILLFI